LPGWIDDNTLNSHYFKEEIGYPSLASLYQLSALSVNILRLKKHQGISEVASSDPAAYDCSPFLNLQPATAEKHS
jgi:hypothetical protein